MSLAFLILSPCCVRPAQAQVTADPSGPGQPIGPGGTDQPAQPVTLTRGYWVFDHLECLGDDIGDGGREMGPYWEFPWISAGPTNPNCDPLGDTNPIFDSYGDAESSSINVTITPFFRWVPGSDPSAPPTILRAKIKSEAYAGDQNGGLVAADNGFGDVSTQFPRGYVFYDDSDKASFGIHLEQKDPQGQTLVSLPPQTLAADGGLSEDSQSISSEVDYLAATDNRLVTISSPIEDSYYLYQGSDGGSHSNRWLHQRDNLGAIFVDSVAQWEEASDYSIQGWHVDNLPLTATPINFLGTPTYSWSLQGLSQGWLTAPTANPTNLSLVEADWHNFPLHGTVKVNATDSDGAVASNTYDVTWHLPTENWELTKTSAPSWQTADLEGTPGTTGPNGSVSGQWSFTEDANGKNLGLGDMFAAASGLVDPPWAAFIALTGIVFSKTQPESPVHSVNFNQAWSDPNSTFQGGTPSGWPNSPPAIMQQYQMKPKLLLEYETNYYQGDQYAMHGYVGPTSESYDKWLAWDFAGDFTPISSPPPP